LPVVSHLQICWKGGSNMTGKVDKRNEKLLSNIQLDNFDFLEIPELYIYSGELTRKEVAYLKERLEEMRRVRENCDYESQVRMRQANERDIAHYFGEMRYRRLQLRMQMNLKEYCERFLESSEDEVLSRFSLRRTMRQLKHALSRWVRNLNG
jgi:hypothetical protein